MSETEKKLLRLVALLCKEVDDLRTFCSSLMDDMHPPHSDAWRSLDKGIDNRISKRALSGERTATVEALLKSAGITGDEDAFREALGALEK